LKYVIYFGAKYDLRSIHAHQVVSKSHAAPVNYKATSSRVVAVRSGDTLERIARRNHTTITLLCKKNGISRTKVLRLGQKLKV